MKIRDSERLMEALRKFFEALDSVKTTKYLTYDQLVARDREYIQRRDDLRMIYEEVKNEQ